MDCACDAPSPLKAITCDAPLGFCGFDLHLFRKFFLWAHVTTVLHHECLSTSERPRLCSVAARAFRFLHVRNLDVIDYVPRLRLGSGLEAWAFRLRPAAS